MKLYNKLNLLSSDKLECMKILINMVIDEIENQNVIDFRLKNGDLIIIKDIIECILKERGSL